MNSYKFLFLFSVLPFFSFAQRYEATYFDQFPDYFDVVKAYYSANNFSYTDRSYLSFAKKYDGWSIMIKNQAREIEAVRLIWSAETKVFQNLKTEGTEPGSNASINQGLEYFLNTYDANFFEQYPVYGYDGYFDDVIDLLKDQPNLTAPLKDALARSYSSKAMNALSPGQFGGDVQFYKYDSTFVKQDFPKEKIDAFLENAWKAIEHFKQLSEQHSDYETIVGSIRMKYYNEYLSAFYALKMIQQDKAAKQFLVEGLYDDFILETAKNYLRSCAKGGVLITFGDNDTYPLIYVQEKLDFRKDVIIINASLLNLGRYIYFQKEVNKIPTTLPMTFYQMENNVVVTSKTGKTQALISLIEGLKQDSFKVESSNQYQELPTKDFTLFINWENLSNQLEEVNPTADLLIDWQINSFLFKNELFILDFIATNDWKQPIYFASSENMTQRLGFKKHTSIEGLTTRFLPFGVSNINAFNKNILENFIYPSVSATVKNNSEYQYYIQAYLTAFTELARFYRQNNEADKLQMILDKMEMTFPLNEINYSYFVPHFAQMYYQMQRPGKGDEYMLKGVQEVQQFFKLLEFSEGTFYTTREKQEINFHLYLANRLIRISIEEGRAAFDNLESLFQPYFDQYSF